jgi:hypothetical protein
MAKLIEWKRQNPSGSCLTTLAFVMKRPLLALPRACMVAALGDGWRSDSGSATPMAAEAAEAAAAAETAALAVTAVAVAVVIVVASAAAVATEAGAS